MQKLRSGRLYVYEVDEGVVGVIDVIVEEDSVYVALLAVKKEYRNRGIGTRLLEFAGDLGRKLGKRYVTTHPEVGAIDYYLKKGFELVERAEGGKIEYLMRKKIC